MPGVTAYDVYRDGALVGTSPEPRFADTTAQVGTLYYFGFFLLMPWWSRLGEFKPVPDRITFAH